MTMNRNTILTALAGEMARNDLKWGEQNHPNGTGGHSTPLDGDRLLAGFLDARSLAEILRERTDIRFAGGADRPGTWTDILLEEVFEALAEDDSRALATELLQVAAVALQWIEAIARASSVAPSLSPEVTETRARGLEEVGGGYGWIAGWVRAMNGGEDRG